MNWKEKQDWLKAKYPCTVVMDRYHGTYSGAEFLAFPLDFDEVPEDVNGEDGECIYFWDNYADPVGKGVSAQAAIDDLVAQMESKDEKMMREIIRYIREQGNKPTGLPNGSVAVADMLAYLEKQKESLHIPETCKENADSFTDACKDVIVAIEKYLDWLTGYPDYAPRGKYSIRDMLHCLDVLEKQKEQKPVDLPAGFYVTLPDGKKYYTKEMRCKGMNIKVVEPTPVEWSEDIIRKAVKEVGLTQHQIDWFQTNVFPPKQEWSEEDERMIERLITRLNWITYNTRTDGTSPNITFFDEIEWLKSLPLSLKKKNEDVAKLCSNEWSKEDEEMLVKLLDSISIGNNYEEMRNWLLPKLKFLRHRHHWKPSEEQMDELNKALRFIPYNCDILESLYEQLKKLM